MHPEPGAKESTDPNLIAATQITAELDDLSFPINKKSTQEEPQAWIGELRPQVSGAVLNAFQSKLIDNHTATIRAKKPVSSLLFVSGRPCPRSKRSSGSSAVHSAAHLDRSGASQAACRT
jgi:helicase